MLLETVLTTSNILVHVIYKAIILVTFYYYAHLQLEKLRKWLLKITQAQILILGIIFD